MWIFLIGFLFFTSCVDLTAQYNPGARQVSLSNSDVALSNDVFSLFNNPAGLSQMNWREIGIYYSPAPFGFTEMANGFISYHEPFHFGSVGVGVMTYGFDLYRENKITSGFSYKYINKFFAGAAINFHSLSIKNYGSDNIFYLNLGGLYYLTDYFRLGFSVQNINRASFGKEKDNSPTIFNFGFSVDAADELLFNMALEKDIRYNYSLRSGIEYNLLEYISLRSGFSNEPSRFSSGIGIHYLYFSLDYAFFSHPDLGITHQAGLLISFDTDGSRNSKIKKYLEKK